METSVTVAFYSFPAKSGGVLTLFIPRARLGKVKDTHMQKKELFQLSPKRNTTIVPNLS